MKSEFVKELTELLNRYSKENNSDTPDFILANYLSMALDNFDAAVKERELWYGREKHVEDLELNLEDIKLELGVSDTNTDEFENQDISKKKWLKIDEYFIGCKKIKSNQSIRRECWKRIFNTYSLKELEIFVKNINEFDSVEVKKTSGTHNDLYPHKTWVSKGITYWYEFSFETKWTEAEARENGCPFATDFSNSFLIDPSVWFTVNRLILSEKYNKKLNLK